ncbi:MFS transporter [Actinokineospora auranticolor]|uniref:MDR family MFS transporter n=1 Tax=Actinokineospora auranticolor TaxID=155976 RepID=UPI001FEAAD56|nr:MFS transporter [Actinokineospora auranticolor]
MVAQVGGLPRQFWVLWGGTLVNRLGTMVEPFLALYLTGVRHLPLITVGVVLVVFGCGSFVSHLLGGWLADRIGRRATLTGGMVAAALSLVALGYAESLAGIVVAVFAVGATMDMYRPASAAAVSDVVPSRDQPRAFGLLYWAVNMGFAIAMVIGGALAREGFYLLFLANALTCLVFAVLIWRAVPKTAARPPAHTGSYLTVLKDGTMVAYTLVVFAFAAVHVQSITTLPLAMGATGLSPSDYGLAIGINGVIVLVLQPLIVGPLAARDHSRVVAVGMALLGAGFGLATLAGVTWQYMASVAVWTVGEVVFMTVAQTIVADLSPPELRGRYNGVHGVAWSAANMLGPLAGTWLLHDFGSTTLWLTCLGTGLAGATGQLLLRPTIRRRAGSARQAVLV